MVPKAYVAEEGFSAMGPRSVVDPDADGTNIGKSGAGVLASEVGLEPNRLLNERVGLSIRGEGGSRPGAGGVE